LDSSSLSNLYRAYIDCLNRQDWEALGQFVDDEVEHNGRPLKLSGYRDMLVRDFEDIPDLRFNIELLASSPPLIAARLAFKCSPKGRFLGLSVDGRVVSFAENVFYEFKRARIASVWSVIDKAAIEAQLPR
jgi:predicted ester cyclase